MIYNSRYKWFMIFITAIVLIFHFAGLEHATSALFLFAFVLYFIMHRTDHGLTRWLLAGFALRVILAFMGQYFNLFHYEWDDYFSIAQQIKENLVHGIPAFSNIQDSIHGLAYSTMGAVIYYVFGDYQILIRIVNCFFGTMVADRVFRLTLELTSDRKAALIAALLTLFFPSFIVFSSLDMRDAIIFYLTVEMLYRSSCLLNRKRLGDMAIIACEIVALYSLRTQYLILFTVVILAYWIMRIYLMGAGFRRWGIVTILLLIVLAGYHLLQQSGYFFYLFREINADMAWRTAGGSAYMTGMAYESWWDIFWWMPLRMIHFTFGPFPWNINNAFMALAALESLFLLAIAVVAFSREARKYYHQHPRLYLLLLLFTFIGLLSSAAIDSNYGTAIRHKMNFTFIFFIFCASCLKDFRIRIR